MLSKTQSLQWTLIGLLMIVALSLGMFISQHMHTKKQFDLSQVTGTVLKEARTIKPFSLMDTNGKAFTNTSLKNQWTLMFFGFTHCGSVCPTTMAELGKMYRFLEAKNAQPLPQIVMVSVDPDRDSLARLQHYVHAFDKHFLGARGNEAAITSLTQEMGIAYLKVTKKASETPDDYDIEHTGTIMLFNPQGQLMAFFTSPHTAEQLAKDYMVLSAR